MTIHFTKMHGLGNDFVVIDAINQAFQPNPTQIQQLADRHRGIGFDQLLLVESPRIANTDFHYRIFNADGSEVGQCGNGARCFARFVYDKGLTAKTQMKVSTSAGVMALQLQADGQVTVDMGIPLLQPTDIPFLGASTAAASYQLTLEDVNFVRSDALRDGSLREPPQGERPREFSIGACSLGNPHCVLHVDDIEQAPVAQLGPQIGQHPQFPDGVNVGFMQIINRKHIKLRVYERGAGETQACGSGAAAAVVIGRLQGLLDETVTVTLLGGSLQVHWPAIDTPLLLTGPAVSVFEGSW